jgi:hypothetical protein
MLTNLMVLMAAISPLPNSVPAGGPASYDRPRVEVWTNRGDDPYRTGQQARVFLRADRDAYVTLFRVDTDGRVRVLFPRDPWDDNFVRGGRDFEVSGVHGDDAFDIDDYPGVGYLFAVAAADPYRYDPITSGDHWDYRVIADGRVRGDPYVALTDLAQQMLPPSYEDWDYDIVPYYVQQHYDYPRFLCYDCHRYASYARWDPYDYSCVRFRIVVYDDPYYYPYRYYGGTRVVFTRPFRPEPRFIFKDRDGARDDRFVSHERQRPVNDTRRRGVRGTDLGGRGSVPVPDVGPRRRNDPPADPPRRNNRPEDPRGRPNGRQQPPAQPDRPNRPEDPRGRPNGRQQPPAQPDRPNRPDQGDPARPGRRPDVQPPARRPDPPARADDAWRRPAERPSQPPSRPQGDGRWDRTPARPQPEARPNPPRRAQPADRGSRQSPRAAPRAQAGRSRQPAPSKGSGKSQPQLKRRRP